MKEIVKPDNFDSSSRSLMNQIMGVLYHYPRGMMPNAIRDVLFPNIKGPMVDDTMNRLFVQLTDYGLLVFEKNGVYTLSGKGIRACESRFSIVRRFPFMLWLLKRNVSNFFTVALPIILSIIAIIISIISLKAS